MWLAAGRKQMVGHLDKYDAYNNRHHGQQFSLACTNIHTSNETGWSVCEGAVWTVWRVWELQEASWRVRVAARLFIYGWDSNRKASPLAVLHLLTIITLPDKHGWLFKVITKQAQSKPKSKLPSSLFHRMGIDNAPYSNVPWSNWFWNNSHHRIIRFSYY